MRVNEVARLLGGSIAIYVVMAACSAASGPQGFTSNDGGGSGSSGGQGGDGSGGLLDARTGLSPTEAIAATPPAPELPLAPSFADILKSRV